MKIHNWRDFVRDNLKGQVLEIGALHHPFEINNETSATYLDMYNTAKLKEVHKNNKDVNIDHIVNVEIVSRGDFIPMVHDNTYDAVVSCHVFEHLCNPVMGLFEWARVTKEGGHIYMVVPDMRYTFDHKRELTPVEHLIKDYADGIKETELAHYESFCKDIDGHNIDQALGMFNVQSNIHVHTFTEDSLKELLKGFKVIDFKREGMHVCILIEVRK